MPDDSRIPLLVEQIRRHAQAYPRTLAVRAPGGELTMAGLCQRAEAIAARLRGEGCQPGDRIAVTGKPSLGWLELMAGAMFARCAFAPLSTSLTPGERAVLLGDCRPRLVFADRAIIADDPQLAAAGVPIEGIDEWLSAGPVAGAPDIPQAEDLFSIIYSSGTTGLPKGIAHTAGGRASFIHARPRAGFGPGRISYVSTALCTNFSFLGIITALHWGAGASIASRFSPETFITACEEEGISDVSLVPVQVKRIIDHPAYHPDKLASLQFTMISGSAIELAVKRRLAAEWPGRVLDNYGTTETGGIASLDLKAHPDRLDTVGRLLAGVTIETLDENGRILPAGENGEIAAITPMPMDGYYGREELTRERSFHDGQGRRFILTGDVGFLDPQGFLHITGRSKDMIISGGLNVFAIDIEEALLAHPAVLEAAVIAIPDERWGETPYAFVVLRAGLTASGEELAGWLESRLARTSRPSGLEIVTSLPRNEMGKVLKRVLREPYWQGRDQQVA